MEPESCLANQRIIDSRIRTKTRTAMVQRGEFSAIIASMAMAQLRILSGIYIAVTAFIGVYLFGRAPDIASRYEKRRRKNQVSRQDSNLFRE